MRLALRARRRLLTDQGAIFEWAMVENVCTIWHIDKVPTKTKHSAGNGACERMNQTIKRGLQKILNDKKLEEWDIVLSEVMFAYNTSVHSKTAFTPYFLMFGVEAKIPSKFSLAYLKWFERPLTRLFLDNRILAYRKRLHQTFPSPQQK